MHVEMVESAKENNVRLMEGFMFRFHPQHQKVQELINKNKIGELVALMVVLVFQHFQRVILDTTILEVEDSK